MQARLYHAPLACSLSVRITAALGDVPLIVEQVDINTHKSADGSDYKSINPLGQVTTLITPSGEMISETSAALIWVQAQSENDAFVRKPDDGDYYQMIRWISFISTEIHKQFYRMIFYDELDNRSKDNIRSLAPSRFALLDNHLADATFLCGDHISAADAYLCWAMLLVQKAGLDSSPYQNLNNYAARLYDNTVIDAILADDWQRKQNEK